MEKEEGEEKEEDNKKAERSKEILENLDNLETRRKIRKILVAGIIVVSVAIILFLIFSFYTYFKSPETTLGLGASIDSALISEDGKYAYIKLKAGSFVNISKVKFIFNDNENEYNYETSEGIQEIEVPYSRSFWDWLLGRQFFGSYDYEINNEEIGINDFNNINKIDVLFEYQTQTGQSVDSPVLDTATPTNRTTTSGGSSGGSGNGGNGDGGTTPPPEPTPTCTPDCTGKVCGGDGCEGSCGSCEGGYYCEDGACNIIPGTIFVNEDSSINITLFSDLSGDKINFTMQTEGDDRQIPIHGHIENLSGGRYAALGIGVTQVNVTYTPTTNYFGDDNFKYTITNGTNSKVIQILIVVINTPDPLVFGPQKNLVFAVESGAPSVTKTYKIIDDIDEDKFTYKTTGLPLFASLTPDGYLQVNIDESNIGNYNNIQINVSDGVFNISEKINISIREAKTYYLDAAGNDNNDGASWATAWQTINRSYPYYTGAGNKVQQGDTVVIRKGYYGNFTEDTDAIYCYYLVYRTDWITYKAEDGNKPLFDKVNIKNAGCNGKINGDSYLILDGFNITRGVSIESTSYIKIKNSIITVPFLNYTGYYAPYIGYGDGVSVYGSHYVTIEGNDIHDTDRGIQCKYMPLHVTIKNNYIHDVANDGFSCGTSDLLIEGNYITRVDHHKTYFPITGHKTGNFSIGENVTQIVPLGIAEGIVAATGVSSGHDVINLIQTGNVDFKDTAKEGGDVIGQSSRAIMTDHDVDYAHNDGFQVHNSIAKNVAILNNTIIRDGGQGFKLAVYGGGALRNFTFAHNIIVTNVPCLISGFHGTMHHNVFYGGNCQLTTGVGACVLDNMYNNVFEDLQIYGDRTQIFTDENFVWIKNHSNNIFYEDPNGYGGPSHDFYTNPTEYIDYNIKSLFLDPDNNIFIPLMSSAACPAGNPNLKEGEYIGALPCAPLPSECIDNDGDGYYTGVGCPIDRDCNDSNENIYPGAMEICENSIDENCNGADTLCPPPGTPLDYIAWWRFDGDITDFGPNEAHGIWKPSGSPSFVEGVQGDAVNFAGETYITTPYVNIDPFNFTILAWVKINHNNSNSIVGFGSSKGSIPFISLRIDNSKAGVSQTDDLNEDAYVTGKGPFINDSQWHHVIGIRYNNSVLRLFVDGNLYTAAGQAEGSANLMEEINLLETTSISTLFRTSPSSYFNGSIDEVMIYNRALNNSEISQIYNSQKSSVVGSLSPFTKLLDFFIVIIISVIIIIVLILIILKFSKINKKKTKKKNRKK